MISWAAYMNDHLYTFMYSLPCAVVSIAIVIIIIISVIIIFGRSNAKAADDDGE